MKKLLNIFVVILLLVGFGAGARADEVNKLSKDDILLIKGVLAQGLSSRLEYKIIEKENPYIDNILTEYKNSYKKENGRDISACENNLLKDYFSSKIMETIPIEPVFLNAAIVDYFDLMELARMNQVRRLDEKEKDKIDSFLVVSNFKKSLIKGVLRVAETESLDADMEIKRLEVLFKGANTIIDIIPESSKEVLSLIKDPNAKAILSMCNQVNEMIQK